MNAEAAARIWTIALAVAALVSTKMATRIARAADRDGATTSIRTGMDRRRRAFMRFLETSERRAAAYQRVFPRSAASIRVSARSALANAVWSASASNHCGFTVAPARTSCATTS